MEVGGEREPAHAHDKDEPDVELPDREAGEESSFILETGSLMLLHT